MSDLAFDYALTGRQRGLSAIIKRQMDISIALVVLVCFCPVLLIIALLVKLEDGGPIIHRRRVVGPDGEFEFLKFRSMCVNADQVIRRDPVLWAEFKKNFKLRDDPRVTRIGRFLRKTSLDEFPQLWNVVVGEMSLVGPRCVTPEELQKYGEMSQILLSVKPGISGYWQTEGRQTVSYAERVRMDMDYIANWSLLWDVKILFKTPGVVIKGDGAH